LQLCPDGHTLTAYTALAKRRAVKTMTNSYDDKFLFDNDNYTAAIGDQP